MACGKGHLNDRRIANPGGFQSIAKMRDPVCFEITGYRHIRQRNTLSAHNRKCGGKCFLPFDFRNCRFDFLGGYNAPVGVECRWHLAFRDFHICRKPDFGDGSIIPLPIGDPAQKRDQDHNKGQCDNPAPLPKNAQQIAQGRIKPFLRDAGNRDGMVGMLCHLGLASSSSGIPIGS